MLINIEITDREIPAQNAELPNLETGALVEFHGIVRETEEEKAIPGLDYVAHESMAEKKLRQIAEELLKKHNCTSLHVIHRIGFVPVGETSLYLCISSAHRKEAFLCCGEFIDELKKDVPIWKAAG